MRVCVIGIGYVGAVTAACLARDGHQVVAVDTNAEKAATINEGRTPIVEPGLAELIEANVARHRLTATTDLKKAVLETDLCLVCVGTPQRPNGSLDTSYVESVADQLGTILRDLPRRYLVVYRSTVLPGTTETLLAPRIERQSGKRANVDFGLAYYPEFLREGSAIVDYDEPGAIVFGGTCPEATELLPELVRHASTRPSFVPIKTAEAIKYVNNAWHATKISFSNEIGAICRALDIDSHSVMDIVCEDTRLNISRAYLRPGFAFGGSCLPKDLGALRFRAREVDLETPMLNAALAANDQQLRRGFDLVEAAGSRQVALIGLSFKPDTDDLRSSPFVTLAEMLIGKGYKVRIFDPVVRLSRLTGANQAYVEKHLPHLSELLVESVEEAVGPSETVVIGNPRGGVAIAEAAIARGKTVVDLVRVGREWKSGERYFGLSW